MKAPSLCRPSFEAVDRTPPGWDRVTLGQYLTNNTPHLVTVAVFLLLLVTGLIIRGLQFQGGHLGGVAGVSTVGYWQM